ncbi:hypothetical protein ACN47E_005052 [Coniothyrium glycines]
MSAEQFSKLSLREEMVTTRAGAAKIARSSSQARQNSDQDLPLPSIEPLSPVSPTPSLVISTTNLRYNVSSFGTDLRRRAKRGLEDNEIRMKYCAVSDDENSPDGTKYFYIDDDITVAMGGNLRRPKCTCGANEKDVACKHIYWIGDQILSTVSETLDEPLHLSSDGATVDDIKPADVLETKGLGVIADELAWVKRDEDIPDDDEEMRDSVVSMLSVFEPEDALPGEFKCPESPLTSERSKKYQEFADLFTHYVTRDPGLYLQARRILDMDFQNRVFFEKIESRITQTFNGLDEYISHGPSNASPGAMRFDVPSCAKKLRALVRNIDEYYHEQDKDEDDARDIAVRAAAAFVTILDRVTDRNLNAYEDITWGMEVPSSPLENNLFAALIGSSSNTSNPFVLGALAALPQEDVHRNHWETLQKIEEKLNTPDTPSSYLSAFRQAVYENRKRRASEVREGDTKRAMQE